MNIFVLDEDPIIAAQMSCNKHTVKMIVETSQMLSAVMHKNGKLGPYKLTHANHPCTLWAGKSQENYEWLYEHGVGLCQEYTLRYERRHKCQQLFEDSFNQKLGLPAIGQTPFAQAMPDQYRSENPVEAYRKYYIHDKARFAQWKIRPTPQWFIDGIKQKEI